MKRAWGRGLLFGAALVVGSGLAGTARAEEGVEKAISITAAYGSEMNDTVRATSGGFYQSNDGAMIGITGIVSVGPVAAGASAELAPSGNGIGSKTVGGLAGVRLPVRPHLRLLLLGEAGIRNFYDAPESLGDDPVTPGELSLPYVGGRVGLSWLAFKHVDLGVMAFARTDIGEGTMVVQRSSLLGGPGTATTYDVGGFAAGVALQVGIRFDTTAPFDKG